MENKVFLENLPTKYGIGSNKDKIVIDWKKSVGENVKCLYNDNIYEVKIIDYNPNSTTPIKLEWNGRTKTFSRTNFSLCMLGRLFDFINNDFNLNIGEIVNNLLIVNRIKRNREYVNSKGMRKTRIDEKWYGYKCLTCGWEKGEMVEYAILRQGCGCSCCRGLTVVEGINDLLTMRPDLKKYIIDIEEAKKLTVSTHKSIKVVCPDCGLIKTTKVTDLTSKRFSCKRCSDGIKIPEKFMISILKQLQVEFKTQYSFDNLKNKRYDFYIPNLNTIIEVHGMQHYESGFDTCGGRTLKEEQENDKIKKELALENGIKEENYIVIDCRYSEFAWLTKSVTTSKMDEVFSLFGVNFNKAFEFAITSNIKVMVRDLWNNRVYDNTEDIAKEVGLNRCTIVRYLKQWNSINKCDFNSVGNRVEILKDDVSLGIFDSVTILSNRSIELFGVKLDKNAISSTARGRRNIYKGYKFKYV